MKFNCIVTNPKVVKRWNSLMWDIGLEHEELPESADDDLAFSEAARERKYYGIANGVTYGYFKKELTYWLSCYYEEGHCRCDDRFLSKEDYKIWVSETGKIRRFIKALEKYDDHELVIIWGEEDKENG